MRTFLGSGDILDGPVFKVEFRFGFRAGLNPRLGQGGMHHAYENPHKATNTSVYLYKMIL